jgi:hypothetical protein
VRPLDLQLVEASAFPEGAVAHVYARSHSMRG